MGGEIGFGVRWREGNEFKEIYMRRWTNDLFWRICNPTFLEGGTGLREFIEEAKPDESWPGSILETSIRESEYGLVLIDLPSRECYSRNDYSSAGRFSLSLNSTAINDCADIYLELHKRGWIERGDDRMSHEPKPINLDEFADAIGEALEIGSGEPMKKLADLPYFWLKQEVLKVDEKCDRDINVDELEAWCKAHDWKTPIDRKSFEYDEED